MELPESMMVENLDLLIDNLFGGKKLENPYDVCHSALLTVLNKDALELNMKVIDSLTKQIFRILIFKDNWNKNNNENIINGDM